ncbi:flagellar hook-associated protein FlgL [Mesoaciditoga lauensis]|uniref:flagellar hook-associated protein FlgL n=1 Tax=Mesoaciditoga lauensis TaxID=1495039 RepID=UPI00068B9DFF|nr:flagellar hook-associated protein FlgL [Mesoaciditoga lauensis]
MRISQSMMKNTLINDVDNVLRRLAKLHHQATTGKKFDLPSEDPNGAFLASSYDSSLRQLDAYKSSLEQVNGTLKGYDSMLSQLTSSIQRVHSLVVQASNDTNTPGDRKAIADEIKRIREFIVQLGNTKVGDAYLYSGSKASVPINVSGSGSNTTYFYVSNSTTSNANYLRVGTSVVQTNITLSDIFHYNGDVSDSLLSYGTAGGTTLNTVMVTTNGSETLNGALKIDLTAGGKIQESNGIINDTVSGTTTLTYSGATSVVIKDSLGNVTITSGSGAQTLSPGATLTIVGGTVELSGENEASVISSDVTLTNASGSSVTSLSENQTTNMPLKVGLLDKIINDLDSNNIDEVRGSDLGDLEKYEKSLERVTADIGSREQKVTQLINENSNFNSYITQLLSKAQDADMVKVISDISMQENVYKAALESSAKALLPTLADFLR